MTFAFTGSKKDELVQIIHHARFAQDGTGEDAARRAADGQTVGPAEYVIGGLAPTAAVHKFDKDGGLSGNMLLQIWDQRPEAHLANSTWRAAANESNGLSLIEWNLSESSPDRGRQGN